MTDEEKEEVHWLSLYPKSEDMNGLDERARLANMACQLIWDKHSGKSFAMSNDLDELRAIVSKSLRNVYELINARPNEIPLLSWYRLEKAQAILGWTSEQQDYALQIAWKACVLVHGRG